MSSQPSAVGPNTLLLTAFWIMVMIEAETGRRYGSVAALLFLSAAQQRVLLALADVNPVGADGGAMP